MNMTLKPKQGFIPFLEEHTIIIDPGKRNVKVFDIVDGTIRYAFKFPSITHLVPNFNGYESASEKQFRFEHEGERYLVGEVVNGDHSYETTKVNRHHQVCIYTAIARLVEDGDIVNLIVGFPSSDFKNEETFNQYKDMIRGTEGAEIEVHLNGERKSFTIRDFAVYPEGMALYTRQTNSQKSKTPEAYHVIDVGGQNVNYRLYDRNGNSSSAYSLDLAGMNYLQKELRKALRDAINGDAIDLRAIDFEEVVETGVIPNVDQINGFASPKDFVDYHVKQFIVNHIEKALADDVNLKQKGYKIIFTGGGSLRLKPYLEELYAMNKENLIFSTHPIYDNCASYLISYLLEQVHNGKMPYDLGERAYMDFIQQLQSKHFEERRQLSKVKTNFWVK